MLSLRKEVSPIDKGVPTRDGRVPKAKEGRWPAQGDLFRYCQAQV